MKRDDIKFKIDQLRKDKMIFALEACALSLASFIFLSFAFSFLPSVSQNIAYAIAIIVLALPILYTIYMFVTNFMRYKKILELEKKLKL